MRFEETFADPDRFARDWIPAPGMSVRGGVLVFDPGQEAGYCVGVTRRTDFRDGALTVDVRVVRATVGLVLRAAGPGEYYMVQFDLANDPSIVWFHTFTPGAPDGYRLVRVASAHAPREGEWHRMRVAARGHQFDVLLGEPDGPLLPCASWTDPERTYDEGAVGLWQHGGEAAEYRRLVVEALPASSGQGAVTPGG